MLLEHILIKGKEYGLDTTSIILKWLTRENYNAEVKFCVFILADIWSKKYWKIKKKLLKMQNAHGNCRCSNRKNAIMDQSF